MNDIELMQAWERAKSAGITKRVLAQTLGMTETALHGKLYRIRVKAADNADLFNIADFGKPLNIEINAVVIGDIHVPATDYDFSMLPGAIANKYLPKGKRYLIIAGDLFNFEVASYYAKQIEQPTLDDEINAAEHLFDVWLKEFDRIIFLMGNHDRRISKILQGQVHAKHLMRWLTKSKRVISSDYGWCVIKSGGKEWRITHSRNYSINQLTVADVLAQKYQMNIISHHEHHLAKGWDRFGRYVIINNGGLFDQEKFAYVCLDDSKHASMKKGFTLLKDGVATVFGEAPYTDWSIVL